MNKGGATNKQIQRIDTFAKENHLKMDVINGTNEEESVDALIAKLNQKGAKVKLVNDEEEAALKTPNNKTPSRTPGKTPTKKHQKTTQDKENIMDSSAPGVDAEKLREMEEA